MATNALSADSLLSDPILGQLSAIQLSKLLPHIETRVISAGAYLYQTGDAARTVYMIQRGTIRLECASGRFVTRSEGYAGEEALLGIDTHTDAAIAVEDSDVLAIPAVALADIAAISRSLRELFFKSYASRYDDPGNAATSQIPTTLTGDATLLAIAGWLQAIVWPVAVYFIGPAIGLSDAATDFLAIISVTVCMWLFGLVPEYVPPLFAALAVILLDVAPPEQALSGFRSESFFICLSIFGIGALMVASGVTYRFSLWVLSRVPSTPLGYSLSLFGLGSLLSPIIPSVVGRMTIISPFLVDLVEISKAGRKDVFANRLIFSLTAGVSIFVPLFLTASVPNLVIYGLLDPQTQFAFDWLSWFNAASVFGLLVLVSYFAVSVVLFRGARQFSIPRQTILEQRRILGPIARLEWIAILAVSAMTLGILTEALHGIDVPWVALAIFVTLMLFGSLQREALRNQIDWPVLVYIGAIVGWVPIAASIGLDTFIVSHLGWLGAYMRSDFPLFILMLSAMILLVRLALPTGVTVVLFATALFPLAIAQGTSLWLIGFVILAVADTFIFPYQSSYFLKLRNDLAARGMAEVCDEQRIITANIVMLALRIGAIYGSLIYWQKLDLI
ncbi:SLC13 family permease [Primorskyibacter marinus]|uniref:SLC13 family permease n=1 Tax=Primorskyibacter marinus TaxID=1977320 RepID=UPI000E308263|nr:SLC13 family permease [Primorskyibacter marinus]